MFLTSTYDSICFIEVGLRCSASEKWANKWYVLRKVKVNLLRAPPLHNASQKTLFQIISNIGTKVINSFPIVTIWAPYYLWCSHTRLERGQHLCEWCVQKLSTKFTVWHIILVLFFRWYRVQVCITSMKWQNLLLGIARKPRRTRPFLCARRALLWMFPMERYTGQYSVCPVATETVVLSLPRMMGTSMDPCVMGSSAIISYNYQ